ncbi:MAG TPA: aminodeoxychorismate synthase component I [Candidatus Omnitrophica bacterium]|nr:aminodeoxychorismate synthase component I [Candidatus Omnitrophota bacterium]
MEIEHFPYSRSPLDTFRNFKDFPYSALLLSGIKNPLWGRYSFLTAFPYMIFKSKGRDTSLIEEDGKTIERTGNPFHILKEIYTAQKRKRTLPASVPFTGGLIGYFAYDMGFTLENIPESATDDLNLPDCILPFYDWVLYWDYIDKQSFLVWIDTPRDRRKKVRKLLEESPEYKYIEEPSFPHESFQLKSNFEREEYLSAVVKAKDYIRRGDIFQVNLSQRFSCSYLSSPFGLFERLSRINPAPFSVFFNYPEMAVISSSPERFLHLEGGKIHTRPIKGTRPRGKNEEEDKSIAEELLNSPKDRAELIMIIDLERNDVGKFCYYGSVKVKELITLEAYPTVFHTVSTIEGRVVEGTTPIECLKYCFPGGSITGAPKVRSMEIIEELEPTRRNIYTGAIGYISWNGRMDLNIVIRTIIIKDRTAYFQVGGGIVADSDPELEYEETLHKGRALAESLLSGSREKEKAFGRR